MPYQLNQARRHKFSKAQYKVKNWSEYDQALQERGSLTVWVTPEAIAAGQAPPTGQRGWPPVYSNLAIETGHLLRLAFGRPWRQTEGLPLEFGHFKRLRRESSAGNGCVPPAP